MAVAGGTGVGVAGGTGVAVAGGIGVAVAGGTGVAVAGGIGVAVSGGIGVGVSIGLWKRADEVARPAAAGYAAITLTISITTIRVKRAASFMRCLLISIIGGLDPIIFG